MRMLNSLDVGPKNFVFWIKNLAKRLRVVRQLSVYFKREEIGAEKIWARTGRVGAGPVAVGRERAREEESKDFFFLKSRSCRVINLGHNIRWCHE